MKLLLALLPLLAAAQIGVPNNCGATFYIGGAAVPACTFYSATPPVSTLLFSIDTTGVYSRDLYRHYVDIPAYGDYEQMRWYSANADYYLSLFTTWDASYGIYQKFIQKYNAVDRDMILFGPRASVGFGSGIQLNQNTSGSKPTCEAITRFTFWSVPGGAGVKDTVEVCAKDAADNYAWRAIY